MTRDAPENGHEHPIVGPDAVAHAEYVAYVATLLPEMIALVASEPELVEALKAAHAVAMRAVARLEGTPVWKKAGLPTLTEP